MSEGTQSVLDRDSFDLPKLDDISARNFSWQIIFFPLTCVRWKYVFWALLSLGVIMVLFFGNKDAGSVTSPYDYTSYKAGSIFKPESYEGNSSVYDPIGLNGPTKSQVDEAAKDINQRVAAARNRNMPGVIVGLVMFAGGAVLAYAVAWGMLKCFAAAAPAVENRATRTYFLNCYTAKFGAYSSTIADSIMEAPIGLIAYAVRVMANPAEEPGLVAAGIPLETIKLTRMWAHTTCARLWLLFDGDPLIGDGPSAQPYAAAAQPSPAQGVPAPGAPAQSVPMQGAPAVSSPAQAAPAHVAPPQPAVTQAAPVQGASAQGVRPRGATTTSAPGLRFCPECGAPLTPNAHFCPLCGFNIDTYKRSL